MRFRPRELHARAIRRRCYNYSNVIALIAAVRVVRGSRAEAARLKNLATTIRPLVAAACEAASEPRTINIDERERRSAAGTKYSVSVIADSC